MPNPFGFDEVGYWSEIKLDILREYAAAYSTILAGQQQPSLYHVYIDAFAGAGLHIARSSQELIPGSPLNALAVRPPFREYHFIEIDAIKASGLRELVGDRPDIHIYEGDCNEILLSRVFRQVQWEQYRRGLCILDPYGLHLKWEVVRTAGQMKTVDLFLNFPVMDMNRNVLWHKPERAALEDIKRMDEFWGDEAWRKIAYSSERNLFGLPEKEPNETVADAYRKRLEEVAGFKRVPEPLPMRNSRGAIVYYLFFASQRGVAEHIVLDIFKKYRDRGGH
jgi:three-Cys-motif partner protein